MKATTVLRESYLNGKIFEQQIWRGHSTCNGYWLLAIELLGYWAIGLLGYGVVYFGVLVDRWSGDSARSKVIP